MSRVVRSPKWSGIPLGRPEHNRIGDLIAFEYQPDVCGQWPNTCTPLATTSSQVGCSSSSAGPRRSIRKFELPARLEGPFDELELVELAGGRAVCMEVN